MYRIISVFLVILLAGCAQSAPPISTLHAPKLTFEQHPTNLPCSSCFEPSATVAAGSIIVSDGYEGKLAVTDEAHPGNFTARPLPPLPDNPPGRLPQTIFNNGDNLVQTAPDGRLFFSRLYLTAAAVAVLVVDGLQVASSTDAGRTWQTNRYVSFRDMPGGAPREQALNADRQWLGFGPSGEVYLSISHFAAVPLASTTPGPWGIYVARSDDGGRTFGAFLLIKANSDRGGSISGVAGGVVTDSNGTVYLPVGDRSAQGGPAGLVIARSRDRGATFDFLQVPVQAQPATWMPRAAIMDGRLAVAWIDTVNQQYVASTTDEGKTWASIRLPNALVGPWIDAGPNGFDVAWTSGDASKYTLHLTRIPASAWSGGNTITVDVVSGSGLHGGSDFTNLVHTHAGLAVVPWADSQQRVVGIAIEAASS